MKRYQVLRDCFGFKGRSWKRNEVVELGDGEKPPFHFHDLSQPLPKSFRLRRAAVSDKVAKRAAEIGKPVPFEETGAQLLGEQQGAPEPVVEPTPEPQPEPQPEPAPEGAPEPAPADEAPASAPKGKKGKKKKA